MYTWVIGSVGAFSIFAIMGIVIGKSMVNAIDNDLHTK